MLEKVRTILYLLKLMEFVKFERLGRDKKRASVYPVDVEAIAE